MYEFLEFNIEDIGRVLFIVFGLLSLMIVILAASKIVECANKG